MMSSVALLLLAFPPWRYPPQPATDYWMARAQVDFVMSAKEPGTLDDVLPERWARRIRMLDASDFASRAEGADLFMDAGPEVVGVVLWAERNPSPQVQFTASRLLVDLRIVCGACLGQGNYPLAIGDETDYRLCPECSGRGVPYPEDGHVGYQP
jgi:hypothetical protein